MTIKKYRQLIEEAYARGGHDLSQFRWQDRVRFTHVWDAPATVHEGVIEIIDASGGGLCSDITPSFDIGCEDAVYKHVSIVHVEKIGE